MLSHLQLISLNYKITTQLLLKVNRTETLSFIKCEDTVLTFAVSLLLPYNATAAVGTLWR